MYVCELLCWLELSFHVSVRNILVAGRLRCLSITGLPPTHKITQAALDQCRDRPVREPQATTAIRIRMAHFRKP